MTEQRAVRRHFPRGHGRGPDAAREARRVERRDLDRERGEPLAAGERQLPPPRSTPRRARPVNEWDPRPRILVTNDDGIESRGLLALKQALEPLGDVFVLAPETNQSAVGHTKTFMRPLRVRERTLSDGSIGWSVDGSPTDAVSLAFLGYFDIGFDLVASGINYGANLGDDITYSGTVSAAMEAVLSACPAFAISQEYYEHPDFSLASRIAYVTAVNILEHGLGPGELININVPAIREQECEGVEVTRMGKRVYQDELIERLDPRGIPYYWIGGPPPSGLAEPGTDFHAVVNRRIAVTPIQLDLTARRVLGRLNSWSWDLPLEQAAVPAAAEADTRADERLDEIVTAQAEPEAERR
ncbi:MAG TPA: 5'/3'-nucleotidase SurE [Candidatus Caenarcaniphilales bacterium]|nr:5'/3'-nucleotidase SurE [Candidatus Caenarcaniphilales bacterium]